MAPYRYVLDSAWAIPDQRTNLELAKKYKDAPCVLASSKYPNMSEFDKLRGKSLVDEIFGKVDLHSLTRATSHQLVLG
jgi:hypothetical protein